MCVLLVIFHIFDFTEVLDAVFVLIVEYFHCISIFTCNYIHLIVFLFSQETQHGFIQSNFIQRSEQRS